MVIPSHSKAISKASSNAGFILFVWHTPLTEYNYIFGHILYYTVRKCIHSVTQFHASYPSYNRFSIGAALVFYDPEGSGQIIWKLVMFCVHPEWT